MLAQFMSSGMTESTAGEHINTTCRGTFREDLVGLRPLGSCSYRSGPNFGVVDIDWTAWTVTMKIMDATSGSIATDQQGVLQQVSFSLDTCMQV